MYCSENTTLMNLYGNQSSTIFFRLTPSEHFAPTTGEESNGEDIRIFVVGDKIIASMKRSSEVGEFRSNVHRGGSTEVIMPTKKEQSIALNATKHLGLGVAGVDLIRSKKGPLLIEVNASPGLQGIEAATGLNIAKEIILFVEKNGRRRRK